ncbi:MAG TPA: sigma-70 family RNA polymerase sigma factor [Tepidisphaeraceae bacterium]|jgi:RNA polymerase sigma-70 factor (ECF subfamily)|nr:sigma-70 family RNA polymerase sigma factor [Tepidisphaeraceae bacterium]
MKLNVQQFEKLALAETDVLYRVACRLTGSTERAGDLVQETFLRALRSRDGFDLQEHGIRPWLIRIMHNIHLTQAERQRREPVLMDVQSIGSDGQDGQTGARGDGGGGGAGDWGSAPFAADFFQNIDEKLLHALESLPSEYRVVLLLWSVEEMSYREIADAVNVPIGTVMSRLHRARRRLAAMLQEFAPRRVR